ncbi:MAG TPA: Hsp70 family protein [Thermoanaerobaculia bacterium]|nr:Hsp70 family protein [Thermoanaerobaculia bacterium]
MKLGIDFGTTHTVVALVDRGNYPVVAFDGLEAVPSLVASRHEDGALRFGAEAAAVRHQPHWTALRSFKRLLDEAGLGTEVAMGPRAVPLLEVLVGFFNQLHRDLVTGSNAGLTVDEPLEVAISVPATASTAQRFLTLEAFRRSGFEVKALLNEPSAAGLEYAHRYRNTLTPRREHVVVYDLGGGTFDASLVKMSGRDHEVVATRGAKRLGGDDFDEAILALVVEKARLEKATDAQRAVLLDECARQKESVGPNTKRFLVDLSAVGGGALAIPMEEIYAACEPLVEETIDAVAPLLEEPGAGVSWDEVAGLYVVGGGGAFPLVARRLKERFGERRVRRSPYPFAATAIGLAAFLDEEGGWTLTERLTRHFGVFREAERGGNVSFDLIFPEGTPLPRAGEPPLVASRRYAAVHNIGHLRYLECSRVSGGRPDGDVTPWEEVLFPYDPALRDGSDLGSSPVVRTEQGPEVEETYTCGPEGAITVTVSLPADGFSRTYSLRR